MPSVLPSCSEDEHLSVGLQGAVPLYNSQNLERFEDNRRNLNHCRSFQQDTNSALF